MKNLRRTVLAALGLVLTVCAANQASAQSATVTLSTQKQYIRGFGGISHAAWLGDLTAAERTLAFGNATGQLGFSVLRIPVSDGNPGSSDVATAKAAIAAGAIVFASPWNAAHTYTSSDFASYATHLNNFVSYMKNQSVDLYAISVQNEPDYGSQAGWGAWTAAACHDFVLNYGASITTKLMSCESFNYQKSYYDAILNDPAALANVDVFGTHLYGTSVNAYAYPNFVSKGNGKEMWMTEHYTNSNTDANKWPDALGVASELHNSMVTGQFNAYVFWPVKRSYGPINSGAVTKRGGCMGQWSKFVRPGFYRVDATASPASGVSLSAYKSDASVVVVVVNTNNSASTLSVSIPGSSIASFAKYTTSSSKTLASDGTVTASNGTMSVSFDASSVTSLVGSGNATGNGGTSGTGGTSSTGGSSAANGGDKATGGSSSVATGGRSNAGGSTATGGLGATSSTGSTSAAGGSTATGGMSSAGGSKATGGAAQNTGGTATIGAGGSATGGVLSTGASPASIGGNNQAGGASPNAGGAPATGGKVASVGGTSEVGTNSSDPTAGDNGSCSCRVVGEGSNSKSLALVGMLGLLAFGSRRRHTKK
jgi:glucuronoarabinoxylan endo-1,4-beta-xylanase